MTNRSGKLRGIAIWISGGGRDALVGPDLSNALGKGGVAAAISRGVDKAKVGLSFTVAGGVERVISNKLDPVHCPGGVCEVQTKEPIQMFSPVQKVITALTMIGLIVGTYLFIANSQPQTFFGEFLHEAVLTDAQLQREKDEAYEREAAAAFADDDEDW